VLSLHNTEVATITHNDSVFQSAVQTAVATLKSAFGTSS
jgi:hypothetical protein